jgi:hypothetical protein
MSPARRPIVLAGVLLAMLAVAAYWSVGWMSQQRRLAAQAAEDLATCRRLADDILTLSPPPAAAPATGVGVHELGQRIEDASRKANLAPVSLEGVFPQNARRLGDTPYLQKPTSLVLRNVSLSQLVTFLYHLTDQSGWIVQDLRLRTPRGDEHGALWDAEATLTCLMNAPPARDAAATR